MSWLKDVIVDIAATILIIVAVFLSQPLLSGLIYGYTGLLLIVKLFVLFGDSFSSLASKAKTEAPEWFSHLLYAINTGVLLTFEWWYTGIAWAVIWLISYLAKRKLNEAVGG